MTHSSNYKKTKVAVALVSLVAWSNAQAVPIDFRATIGETFDDIVPVLSSNSALLSATSSVSYMVSGLTHFDWFFQAKDELPFNDFSVYVTPTTGTTVLASVSTVGDFGNSGWQTVSFASPYTGFLQFAVNNGGGDGGEGTIFDSTLAIKNYTVTVPEPTTLGLLGLGLTALGFARRKRKLT